MQLTEATWDVLLSVSHKSLFKNVFAFTYVLGENNTFGLLVITCKQSTPMPNANPDFRQTSKHKTVKVFLHSLLLIKCF